MLLQQYTKDPSYSAKKCRLIIISTVILSQMNSKCIHFILKIKIQHQNTILTYTNLSSDTGPLSQYRHKANWFIYLPLCPEEEKNGIFFFLPLISLGFFFNNPKTGRRSDKACTYPALLEHPLLWPLLLQHVDVLVDQCDDVVHMLCRINTQGC